MHVFESLISNTICITILSGNNNWAESDKKEKRYISIGHAKKFVRPESLALCLRLRLGPHIACGANSDGFRETAHLQSFAWTFAVSINVKSPLPLPFLCDTISIIFSNGSTDDLLNLHSFFKLILKILENYDFRLYLYPECSKYYETFDIIQYNGKCM